MDFYIDFGSKAPHMESSREWCRLLEDCFSGKVNLIVTQKAGNISDDPEELTFISRILAAQIPPVGIYIISEDIFTIASYFRDSLTDRNMLPDGWETLPEDDLDEPMVSRSTIPRIAIEKEQKELSQEGDSNAGVDT